MKLTIQLYGYGGIDWHDICSTKYQCLKNNQPFMDSKYDIIDILKKYYENAVWGNFINPDDIKKVIDEKVSIEIPMNTMTVFNGKIQYTNSKIRIDGVEQYENSLNISYDTKEDAIICEFQAGFGQYTNTNIFVFNYSEDYCFRVEKRELKGLKYGDTKVTILGTYDTYEEAVNSLENNYEKKNIKAKNENIYYDIFAYDKNTMMGE